MNNHTETFKYTF